jgi:hypothetical protein
VCDFLGLGLDAKAVLHAGRARRRDDGPILGDATTLAAAPIRGRTARSDAMAKRSAQGLASLIAERPVESFAQLDVAG